MTMQLIPFIEENDQTSVRREHLAAIQNLIGNVYPNNFNRSNVSAAEDTISSVVNFDEITRHVPPFGANEKPTNEQHEAANVELNKFRVSVAGRIATTPRIMGKAAFVHLSDGVSRLQIYVRKQDAKAVNNDDGAIIASETAGWELMNLLDNGDFIGVSGFMFMTKTGELSIHVETLQFLAKAMLPMPDKMHGIADAEIKQRQRYADLIASSLKIVTPEEIETERETGIKELTTREVFTRRAKLITGMRQFLDERDFIEVETPMLTPKATGAAAKPFETHHNALDITLYARIAPELYLKRLVVGGFERVYELNRNFRNEGISTRHNPEFTMLEFYAAYWNVNKMMDFCEEMLKESVKRATGDLSVKYGENTIDFGGFEKISMRDAVKKYAPDVEVSSENLVKMFEENVESYLVQPTFVVDFPKSVSPLAKASPQNPQIAERFELYINGMECANGFSELNSPAEQYERFLDQAGERERGDDEAMILDEDYIRALSYGMPPAAGIGIGVDRIVMLLTNRASIRDVILFPHLRPETKYEIDVNLETKVEN